MKVFTPKFLIAIAVCLSLSDTALAGNINDYIKQYKNGLGKLSINKIETQVKALEAMHTSLGNIRKTAKSKSHKSIACLYSIDYYVYSLAVKKKAKRVLLPKLRSIKKFKQKLRSMSRVVFTTSIKADGNSLLHWYNKCPGLATTRIFKKSKNHAYTIAVVFESKTFDVHIPGSNYQLSTSELKAKRAIVASYLKTMENLGIHVSEYGLIKSKYKSVLKIKSDLDGMIRMTPEQRKKEDDCN